jgi:hypothetical protein
MFEVYYLSPSSPVREDQIAAIVAHHGGWLDFRDAPEANGSHICLTYEFTSEAAAEIAAGEVRTAGEYVEGPYRYT